MSTRPGRLRLLVAVTATLVIVVPLARLWYASLIPSTYSMESMGYADLGAGWRTPVTTLRRVVRPMSAP